MRLERAIPVPTNPRPLLAGFAAELILRAFHEASRGSHQVLTNCGPLARAKSRKDTADALRFIRARTDWSRVDLEKRLRVWGSPAPPFEVRSEFICSFEWACSVLGLNPDEVRRHGPPFGDARTFRPAGGLSNWRMWRANRGKKHPLYRDARPALEMQEQPVGA